MLALSQAGMRSIPTGLAHGTVTAISLGQAYEITTLRRDVVADGRHAEVVWTDDWREDAARRDFTFNAMSIMRDGVIFDSFGGIADLRAGIVRFVGDPVQRIAEDRLRALRFFRFHARFGHGTPDPAALRAIADAVPDLGGLSTERIWSELRRLLAAPDPRGAIAMMRQLGVLAWIMPEGTDPDRLARLVASGAPIDPLLRLAALLTGNVDAFAARLRLSNAERDRLTGLRGPAPAVPLSAAGLRQALADQSGAVLADRCWLAGHKPDPRLLSMERPVFPLAGRDLLAAGVPAGPLVGYHLAALRDWWWEGGCIADIAACREMLRQRLQSPP